eukprot:TRINITY_DN4501_c0_g2_i10.p1 TRINITY_DN4501_c0_g2~~TRINITY_DN4501_c0_g2_i10.p1  ORF type:complete len:266 (+),score=43.87 TRINITY_DN4501_c0_g2_i10:40-837(+)
MLNMDGRHHKKSLFEITFIRWLVAAESIIKIIMSKECTLEERHRASRGPQPVHKSSTDTSTLPVATLFPKKPNGTLADYRKSFGKTRSNTMRPECEEFKFLADIPFQEELEEKSPSNFYRKKEDETLKSGTELLLINTKALSTPFVQANAQAEQGEGKRDLRDKLADSLSPSPFRREDSEKRTVKLEQLVASAPCTTKILLSSSFYNAELTGDNGHRAWKIALKDYIANTLEAICIIKRLSPVPLQIIEKRRLPADPKPSRTFHH